MLAWCTDFQPFKNSDTVKSQFTGETEMPVDKCIQSQHFFSTWAISSNNYSLLSSPLSPPPSSQTPLLIPVRSQCVITGKYMAKISEGVQKERKQNFVNILNITSYNVQNFLLMRLGGFSCGMWRNYHHVTSVCCFPVPEVVSHINKTVSWLLQCTVQPRTWTAEI